MMPWLLLSLLSLSDHSYLLSVAEQQEQLTQHAIFPAEGQQHQQLALSLRNQRLLEQQAESRARQMQYHLQAAEALHAMRQLSVQLTTTDLTANPVIQPQFTTKVLTPALTENNSTEVSTSPMNWQIDLPRFRLLALFKRQEQWVARLAYGDYIFAAKDKDVVFGELKIRIKAQQVVLQYQGLSHTLLLGH